MPSASTTVTDAHPLVLECRHGGVAEAEPADEHVEVVAGHGRQPQARQLDLGDGEEARHEELVTELHLVDVDVQARARVCGAG